MRRSCGRSTSEIRWLRNERLARLNLLPHGASRKEVRPGRPERRLRLVDAIAQGRRWLDEIISGSVTDTQQIALRERCSVRHVNMTISLAFLAPKLVRAAVEGRLPRGINIERLCDAPAEWSRQFEALGLNPQHLAQSRWKWPQNGLSAWGPISGLCTETSSSGPFRASVSGENPVPDSTRKKSEGAVWRPQSQ
jgi:hypothetical protein